MEVLAAAITLIAFAVLFYLGARHIDMPRSNCKCCLDCYSDYCENCSGYCACANRDHGGCGELACTA